MKVKISYQMIQKTLILKALTLTQEKEKWVIEDTR